MRARLYTELILNSRHVLGLPTATIGSDVWRIFGIILPGDSNAANVPRVDTNDMSRCQAQTLVAPTAFITQKSPDRINMQWNSPLTQTEQPESSHHEAEEPQ